MWKRSDLKNAAKADLKGFYWLSFAVCLVSGILTGGSNAGANFNSGSIGSLSELFKEFSYNAHGRTNGIGIFDTPIPDFVPIVVIVAAVTFLFIFAIAIGFRSFVSNPVLVGKCKFFVHKNEDDRKFETLFSSFRKGQYISVVKAMFFTDLYIFLWSLLCIFPGIIKSYQYKMVPYILAENPNLKYSQAQSISSRMTYGHKFEMFILELSFILWVIAGFLACCIGIIFVNPYYEATWAQLYKVMRKQYIDSMPKPENEVPEETSETVEPTVSEEEPIVISEDTIEAVVTELDEAVITEETIIEETVEPEITKEPAIEEAPMIEEGPIIEENQE